MKKYLIFPCLLVIGIALSLSACTTRFARTQNLPSKKTLTEQDVQIYLDELPDRPYTVVGILTVKPIFNRWDSVFKGMRKKAAQEGAEGVIRIRTTRDYFVNLDIQQKNFSFDNKDTYYGDAIVFTEPQYSKAKEQ